MDASNMNDFFGGRLIKMPRGIDSNIPSESKNFLIEIGIPDSEIINFTPIRSFNKIISKNGCLFLVIGETSTNRAGINMDDESVVVLGEYESYVNKNISSFVETIYLFDCFHDLVVKRAFGDIRNNRKEYLDFLIERINEIDESINSRGYFWLGVIESIEFGIIYS